MVEMLVKIPDNLVERLNLMMEKSGIDLPQDLINEALTFLEWGINESYIGRIICSCSEETQTFRQLKMDSLENARKISKF